MTIQELKTKIETNKLDDNFMVWQLSDYSPNIIAKQYLDKIAANKNLTIKYINNFNEFASTGFIEDTNLYVYKTDKLDEFKVHDNCIILCNKTSYKDAIKIPKLESWQFVDYLITKVPGMNKADLDWLMTQYEVTDSRVTEINYERLENDIDKIAIFPESMQDMMFNFMYDNGEYKTISNLTMFDLSNALIKRDNKIALEVMKAGQYIDFNPTVWLLSILLNSFRYVIDIQSGIKITAEEMGISDKQYYVVKKFNCGYYTKEELFKIYDILTNAEYMYKFGGLDNKQLIDYLVIKILSIGE